MVNLVIREISDKYTTEDLIKILEILRSPDGCPWDREQTHKSIRNDALEEFLSQWGIIKEQIMSANCIKSRIFSENFIA